VTKSLVLGKERLVDVKVGIKGHKSAFLSADGGRAFRLSGTDTVELRCSRHRVSLVKLTGRSFYELLNHKLGKG
jgi:NAD+ kinase